MCYEPTYTDFRNSGEMLALADDEKRVLRSEIIRLRGELAAKDLLIDELRMDIARLEKRHSKGEAIKDYNAHIGATEEIPGRLSECCHATMLVHFPCDQRLECSECHDCEKCGHYFEDEISKGNS